jgi:hypothetical protein
LFSGSYQAFRVSNTESPSSGLLSTFSSSSLLFSSHLAPETHNKRQATQRCCLPIILGDRDKVIERMNGEEKIVGTGPNEHSKQNKNLLYRHDKHNEPTKEAPLSFVLF